MSPLGVWCHLGAQEQACRRSKCVNSVLVSSASSREVCGDRAGGRVREPRAALCPASRRGRALPVGAAPPHNARSRQPSLPSRPALAKARPATVHPSIPTRVQLLRTPACRCAASRRVAVCPPRTRPAPRDCSLSSALAPRRLPPSAALRAVRRHYSSTVPRAAGWVCVHGNDMPGDGRVSAAYSLSEPRARPQLGPDGGWPPLQFCVLSLWACRLNR